MIARAAVSTDPASGRAGAGGSAVTPLPPPPPLPEVGEGGGVNGLGGGPDGGLLTRELISALCLAAVVPSIAGALGSSATAGRGATRVGFGMTNSRGGGPDTGLFSRELISEVCFRSATPGVRGAFGTSATAGRGAARVAFGMTNSRGGGPDTGLFSRELISEVCFRPATPAMRGAFGSSATAGEGVRGAGFGMTNGRG